ncbi:universal stress protein [Bacillus sp. ISL-4]|nr:universal stress protein [Bacillus sp. ISL-4]MBT2667227.1 universal stress protein [Bacillus sp. ISL-4]MBT2670558.1 universal stress protein [Streptomyces sp. ISL-14]
MKRRYVFYKKILVAFDGSTTSSHALHHAAKLVKKVVSEKLDSIKYP